MWCNADGSGKFNTWMLILMAGFLSSCSGQPTTSVVDEDANQLLQEIMTMQFAQESGEDLVLPVQQKPQCSISGVLLSGTNTNRLIIGLGQRPSAGYGMKLAEQTLANGELKISYNETKPAEGDAVAQVMTSPCMIVDLPDEWTGLRVTENQTGQSVYFQR